MIRKITILVLCLLLTAVTLGSLLFTSARTRFHPIPAHAQIVYDNKNPDWFLSFFPMLGKLDDEFSNHWKKKFQMLETRPLAVATVSLNGRDARDTWVAVSELDGALALALRWRLLLFPPKGVSSVRPYAVWPVWKLEHPSIPAWARVRFSLTDGLLICSVSENTHDLYKLLDAFDGRRAGMESGGVLE